MKLPHGTNPMPSLAQLSVVVLLLATFTGCQTPEVAAPPKPSPMTPSASLMVGPWRAALETTGGELPFSLNIERDGDNWSATISNGDEALRPEISVEGDRVTIGFPHYDSRIEAVASPDGDHLRGEWRKTRGPEKLAVVPFQATFGFHPRFDAAKGGTKTAKFFAGRWRVKFSGSDDEAVGIFEAKNSVHLGGTFATLTGDYRFLAGDSLGDELKLSTFDGGHAFLFKARPKANGELEGDFWSGNWWHETWTAVRDDDFELPNPFSQTKWNEGVELASLSFPDLDGVTQSLADAKFAGRARILQVFGSWCPNCHDASEFLRELHREYAKRGLSIVALAFELTGDFERDAKQVRRYIERHQLEYPVLLAGTADKSEATKSLGALDRVRSYPTTIFLREDGTVHSIHSGFSGPATGPAHDALKRKFRETVEGLLSE
ncbi:MAG: TlpA disulfide reductase family protein [Planctomycetota bacterium]